MKQIKLNSWNLLKLNETNRAKNLLSAELGYEEHNLN